MVKKEEDKTVKKGKKKKRSLERGVYRECGVGNGDRVRADIAGGPFGAVIE